MTGPQPSRRTRSETRAAKEARQRRRNAPLTDLEKAILVYLAERDTLSISWQIARHVGVPARSIASRLTSLAKRDLIVKAGDGYWRIRRPDDD